MDAFLSALALSMLPAAGYVIGGLIAETVTIHEKTISFALGQLPGNIPEAFATVSLFREQGMRQGMRLLLSFAFVLPVLAGTTIGYWLVNGQPVILKYLILAFTAGVLTTLVVEEIVPLAHKNGEARLAALQFIFGFALLTFISTYVE